MIDPQLIGTEGPPRRIEVEKGQLVAFARAINETNPIYFDEGAARAAGYPSLLAPPTFAFSLYNLAPGASIAFTTVKLPPERVLHAGQDFAYINPIFAGDVITITERVADIYAKKGGALEFVAMDAELFNQRNELCVRQRVTLAVRNG